MKWTAEQIIAAGKEGEINHFDIDHLVMMCKELFPPPNSVQVSNDLSMEEAAKEYASKYHGVVNPSIYYAFKAGGEYANSRTEKLREALEDCDTLFASLEDFTHGDDGDRITEQRYAIAEALNELNKKQ